MANCPNCDAEFADGALACPSCGVSLSGQRQQGKQHSQNRTDRRSGQTRRSVRDQSQRDQPQHPQQGRGQPQQAQGQPQQGQRQPRRGQGQPRQGQPARGQPGGHGSDTIAGYERRDVLTYSGGIALLLSAGFVGYTEFVAGPNDSAAESVVRSYLKEQANGNPGEARSLLHPDSTMSPMERGEGVSVSIESVSETEDLGGWSGTAPTGEDFIYVSTTYEVTSVYGIATGTRIFLLRRYDGEWRILSAQTIED